MRTGTIMVNGMSIGTIEESYTIDGVTVEAKLADDEFVPDIEGYTPSGRAEDGLGGGRHSEPSGGGGHAPGGHIPGGHAPVHHAPGHHAPSGQHQHPQPNQHHFPGHRPSERHRDQAHDSYFDSDIPKAGRKAPEGKTYTAEPERGHTYQQGSAETDAAIVAASRAYNLNPNFMRSVAHIESTMDPSSNANRPTQYKGLYQIGHDEWRRFGGGGNIYSAHDNAMAGARLFSENRRQFHQHFGRDPTDAELYMMHQQGLGFYTRGALTNAGGNLPRGEHLDPADRHGSFERIWGRRVATGKAAYARQHPAEAEATPMPTETEPM
jgi:hypothetical protein